MFKKVQALLLREKSVKFSFYYHVFISPKSLFFSIFKKHKLNSLFYIVNLKTLNIFFYNYIFLNLIFPKWLKPQFSIKYLLLKMTSNMTLYFRYFFRYVAFWQEFVLRIARNWNEIRFSIKIKGSSFGLLFK